MADQEQEDIQCWTTKRKVALVVGIIKGETSIQEAARQLLKPFPAHPLPLQDTATLSHPKYRTEP
jgi:hypothetical protein